MQDIASALREYARLDLQRLTRGLSVPELERWSLLRRILERGLEGPERQRFERRSSKRIPTRLRCSYASSEELRRASITRISTGGVFIATTSPLPVGAQLTLRIHIEDTDERIEADAVVVCTNVSPDGAPDARGMGVRFSTVGREALEQIAELYATEAERDHEDPGRPARDGAGVESPTRRPEGADWKDREGADDAPRSEG